MAEIGQDNSLLKVGTILHGTYRIERYLSSGGFGNTYVAKNINFDEVYVVKEFFMRGVSQREGDNVTVSVSNSDNSTLFDSQKNKFRKEAVRLRKLDNPHIVRVHDLFEENGTVYYVMDFIEGMSLRERMNRAGHPMDEKEVLGILRQVLDALDTVHKQKIYHLDLKPANIMLEKDGTAKVIDFGASKQLDPEAHTATSTGISYTNGYAPTEQIECNLDKIGPWTDFYALGATLYNLLSGNRPPLPSDISYDETPDKRQSLPMPLSVSREMRNLIIWLMQGNWKKRPQSVGEIYAYIDKNLGAKSNATEPVVEEKTVYDSGKAAEESKQDALFPIIEPEAVDLGLSVKWASFNLGASKPEEYGNYYAWGETTPEAEYDSNKDAKYPDGSTLKPEDDAATANLGGRWRMPTSDEVDELISKCKHKWTKINGVKGMRVTGFNGKSIFFPVSGYRDISNELLNYVGSDGYYWSASASSDNYCRYLGFYSSHCYMINTNRVYGFPVRPVLPK